MKKRDLFVCFLAVGLSGMGGNIASHVYYHVVSRRKWIKEDDFLEASAISQILPGPNVVNLVSILGIRLGGVWGAVVSIAAFCLPGLGITLFLAYLYHKGLVANNALAAQFLHGVTVAALGAGIAVWLKTLPNSIKAYGGSAVLVLTAVAMMLKFNLLLVMLGMLALGLLLEYARDKT